jgi:hypothetical protein
MAREFRVADEAGIIRATLSASNGDTSLFLNDTSGRPHIVLAVNRNGHPSVAFLDENGNYVPVAIGPAATASIREQPMLPDLPQAGGGRSPFTLEADVRTLQGQIDLLWDRVTKLLNRELTR